MISLNISYLTIISQLSYKVSRLSHNNFTILTLVGEVKLDIFSKFQGKHLTLETTVEGICPLSKWAKTNILSFTWKISCRCWHLFQGFSWLWVTLQSVFITFVGLNHWPTTASLTNMSRKKRAQHPCNPNGDQKRFLFREHFLLPNHPNHPCKKRTKTQ